MITYRLTAKASPEKRRQLAETMASKEEPERLEEFVSWLDNEFATLEASERFYIVAELQNRIIGFVRIWHSPHIAEWVNDGIVVDPAHRRQGVGKHLLETALSVARTHGAKSVVGHVRTSNVATMRLHESVGFKRETPHYRNSYGDLMGPGGWQYRLSLDAKQPGSRKGRRGKRSRDA